MFVKDGLYQPIVINILMQKCKLIPIILSFYFLKPTISHFLEFSLSFYSFIYLGLAEKVHLSVSIPSKEKLKLLAKPNTTSGTQC